MKSKLIIAAILFFTGLSGYSQVWHNLGNGVSGFSNAAVYALYYDSISKTVYAGGRFTNAGTDSTYNIASYNSGVWDSVGSGFNDAVNALVFYKGNLYAGGDFTRTADTGSKSRVLNYIAKWTGTRWDTVGKGLNSVVYAMTVFNGKLYVGGDFTTAGGKPANFIACWDSTKWDTVGPGFNDDVFALASYSGSLYAGGLFDQSSSTLVNHIAQLSSNRWYAVGGGINRFVNALASYNGSLYAGGNFDSAGNIVAYYIASWNGTRWDTVGQGTSGDVYALTPHNGLLYVGGGFTTAENITVNNIASWNGTVWDSLGAGTDAAVWAIAPAHGIYAGGSFLSAGNDTLNYVALWDTGRVNSVNELRVNSEELRVYPNPNNGAFTISAEKESGERVVEIYNMLGEKVYSRTFNIEHSTFNIKLEQPAGMYFYRVIKENGELIGSGKFVIE